VQPTPRRRAAAGNVPLLVSSAAPRIPSGRVGRSIVAVLRKDPARSWTPGEIAEATRLKKATITKELCRLIRGGNKESPPPVERVAPGLYSCFLGPQELTQIENPEPRVHALQIVWKAGNLPRFGGSPPRSRGRTREAGFGMLHAEGDWVHDEGSRSYRCKRFHEGLKITLQAYPTTGTLMASIDSSKTPLSGPDLAGMRIWLQATLQAEGYAWTEPRVATVEINRDFQRVRLRGREAARFFMGRLGLQGERSLSLGHLEGALVQVYNKHSLGVMRQEIRLQPRELDLPNLQALVTSMFYGPMPEMAADFPDPEGGYA